MPRQVPDVLYGPAEHVASRITRAADAEAAEPNPRCVNCALEGISMPLAVFYLVGGTSMCAEHARRAVLK